MAPASGDGGATHLASFVTAMKDHTAWSILTRSIQIPLSNSTNSSAPSIYKRDTTIQHGQGVTAPEVIPNNAIFALFGLIGAGFVITGIWFFFWAKNGGFVWRENDWEDYVTTVLRRKGPNGTTLSGATESTDLGGGSVVGRKQRRLWRRHRDQEKGDEESSVGTAEYEKRAKKEKKLRDKEGKRKKRKSDTQETATVATDVTAASGLTVDDLQPEEVVRAYRREERPAKVGGINKLPDSTVFESSTGTGDSDVHSDLLANRERTPTSTPKKVRHDNYTGGTGTASPGIRHVQPSVSGPHGQPSASKTSWWSKKADDAKIQAEARKLREKGRAALEGSNVGSGRRDFSYTPGDDDNSTVSARSSASQADDERRARREARRLRHEQRAQQTVPGSYAESEVSGVSEESGTKAYHHPIPGLGASQYAEERRKAREGRGYRRE
jgi:hypothetical protein